jgi:CHASE2 domain-containing sensor protein
MNPEVMGLAMLAAGDAAAMLSGVNPSIFTIRTFRSSNAHASRTQSDIHTGMVLGSALAIVVGYGAALVVRSWWPLFVTLATLAVLNGAYEWALRNPHNLHANIADQ